jgi:hypothetical protein
LHAVPLCCSRPGREASPTAAIIDSQRRGRPKRGSALDPQGFDAGKKVTGRKRHILVDTLGLLFGVSILLADVQDRDGAGDLLRGVAPKRWIVEHTFAWISRNRRLARDFERYAATVAAFVRLAMIRSMLKRLTKPNLCS